MREFLLEVQVKPGSKRRRIEISPDGKNAIIWTTARAIEGAANEDVVDMLAEHYGTAKSNVSLIRGLSGKKKIIKIMA